jgi:hypothetical protein
MTRKTSPALGLILLTLGMLLARPQGEGAAQNAEGFLFRTPKVTLSFNLGYGMARAGSSVFEEIDTLFTLGRRDFDSPVVGGALAVMLSERLDLVLDIAFMRSDAWSEYVDWDEMLDNGETVPIVQRTRFQRVPLNLSVRYFLMDRGRRISRFAWVPNSWSPFIGGGVGRVFYEFVQDGDFVDYYDETIFTGRIVNEGNGWAAHLAAGAEVSLTPRFVLTTEGRYSWADAEMDPLYFEGHEPIDLSGFRGTVGIGVRF